MKLWNYEKNIADCDWSIIIKFAAYCKEKSPRKDYLNFIILNDCGSNLLFHFSIGIIGILTINQNKWLHIWIHFTVTFSKVNRCLFGAPSLAVEQSSLQTDGPSRLTFGRRHQHMCKSGIMLIFYFPPKRTASLAERKQELPNQTTLLPYPDFDSGSIKLAA